MQFKIDRLMTDGAAVTIDCETMAEVMVVVTSEIFSKSDNVVSWTVRPIPVDNGTDTDDNDERVCINCREDIPGMGVYVFRYPFFTPGNKDMKRSTGELICLSCHEEIGNVFSEPPVNGTVSHGTLRPADLLFAFAQMTDQINHEVYLVIHNEFNLDEDGLTELAIEAYRDFLETTAPVGYYFGANEGDGSDFGYWKSI